eukprot:SAG22_NODE_5807_length_949_cov_1.336471_2_plen_90_part_01
MELAAARADSEAHRVRRRKAEQALAEDKRKAATQAVATRATPPTSATASLTSTSSPERAEIEALYRLHNPEKLADVDGLLAKYGAPKLLG